MNTAQLSKLELQVQRFFRRGFKRGHFTKDIHEAFYVYTGKFIAHFDRYGFYKARFQEPQGFFETIDILKGFPPARWKTESDCVRSILGAYARDYLARMEIVDKFLEENKSA